jgi:hypothetical protein
MLLFRLKCTEYIVLTYTNACCRQPDKARGEAQATSRWTGGPLPDTEDVPTMLRGRRNGARPVSRSGNGPRPLWQRTDYSPFSAAIQNKVWLLRRMRVREAGKRGRGGARK